MKKDHCDFCDAIVERYDGQSVFGSVEVTQHVRSIEVVSDTGCSYTRDIRTADAHAGAWCSLDHLIKWLQEELGRERVEIRTTNCGG